MFLFAENVIIIMTFVIGVYCIPYVPGSVFREYRMYCMKLHKLRFYMELVRKPICLLTESRKAFFFALVITLLDFFLEIPRLYYNFCMPPCALLLPV